ncbi:hypothetical protein BU24DRAFT_328778, partial [Aaosphaeria arxii CBS 175.79]
LLDMLTADAAAKHGHEYSPPRPSDSRPSNGHFLSQMPLSIFNSVIRGHTAPQNVPSPFVEESTSQVDAPERTKADRTVVHEHDSPILSPPPSRPVSSGSNGSLAEKPKKRGHRPKTIYNLAQPPPFTGPRQKLHIRPKVLLQLHQVYSQRRPKPVYEVIPFSLLAPRSTRRLARTFNTKGKLCPNDLLIVKADTYDASEEDEKSDDERWGTRDVMGIICPSKKGDKEAMEKTEILLDDGSHWDVTLMPNGGYEFTCVDEHGLLLKSRWIPKPVHSRRVSTMSSSSQGQAATGLGSDLKFNFSTISANSRRHPVIATMSRASINVLDSYKMPDVTSPTTPVCNTAPITPDLTPNECPSRTTDETLRRFIVASGIWVAFSEHWSVAYNNSKNVLCPLPLSTALIPPPNRTVSMSFIDTPRSISPASTLDDTRRSIPKLIRASTQKLQRRSSFTNQPLSPVSTRVSPSSSPRITNRSRRSNSTGNADLNIKRGSFRLRHGMAFEELPLPETEEERVSKHSIERLRIREVGLPDTPPDSQTLNSRALKAQSAYEPVTTAGLWDSGVTEGKGLKSRPTSMFVMNEKKEKAKKREARSRSK